MKKPIDKITDFLVKHRPRILSGLAFMARLIQSLPAEKPAKARQIKDRKRQLKHKRN